MTTTTIETPLGPLALAASAAGLTRCTFRPIRSAPDVPAGGRWLELAATELRRYFAGEGQEFTVPVDLSGVGAAHRRILDGLRTSVPYGATTTYGTLAAGLGLVDDGARQVGGAMARNPVLIVVPCHRVLGAGGRLTGFAAGLPAKQYLLDLESVTSPSEPAQLTFGGLDVVLGAG
jgi:methylated-DNA-[protein]-cysteine S-methyltransferase